MQESIKILKVRNNISMLSRFSSLRFHENVYLSFLSTLKLSSKEQRYHLLYCLFNKEKENIEYSWVDTKDTKIQRVHRIRYAEICKISSRVFIVIFSRRNKLLWNVDFVSLVSCFIKVWNCIKIRNLFITMLDRNTCHLFVIKYLTPLFH